MTEARRLGLAVVAGTVVCALAVAYSIAAEHWLPGMEGYLKRRIHYERVIAKKGLSLHEARYWRPEGAPAESARPSGHGEP
jgi:hypothetical protein